MIVVVEIDPLLPLHPPTSHETLVRKRKHEINLSEEKTA